MDKAEVSQKITERIRKLEQKYQAMGQDMVSYLDGLLHADFLKYWDYLNLDSLLGLQQPKTSFPDEIIFITYHQITELYFKMVLWEMQQIHALQHPDLCFFVSRLKRINSYFEQLCQSFTIMTNGMEKEQFLKFRMSLLPSSGFQSGQYRMIEIRATDMINLVSPDKRDTFDDYSSLDQLYDSIYWKAGATELASGKKTLTLQHFEEKYSRDFLILAEEVRATNFYQLFQKHYKNQKDSQTLIEELRWFDLLANVEWPLAHYRSAMRHLQRKSKGVSTTGGTNWRKYLPPKFQKIIFFPDLWSQEERKAWGKNWVLKQLSEIRE